MSNINQLLFLQHGWADTNQVMLKLGETLVGTDPHTVVTAPNLGWWRTWRSIDPLREQVEAEAIVLVNKYPSAIIKIIGHSLGGLIWLEILERHPEWWERIHSLVLLASPVGGSDLGRIFDPLGWLPLIARDLAKDRRTIAVEIAKKIPTLAIAGDWDQGSDGTVVQGSTQFLYANWHCIDGAYHAQVRYHPRTIELINNFWQSPTIPPVPDCYQTRLLKYLYTQAITPAHHRDLKFARPVRFLREHLTLWHWISPLGVRHIFITNAQDEVIISGFVGWAEGGKLMRTIARIGELL